MSDNSGTAFPRADCGTPGASPYYPGTPGLTKRELFAAMAMVALIVVRRTTSNDEPVSQAATGYADALLAELAK